MSPGGSAPCLCRLGDARGWCVGHRRGALRRYHGRRVTERSESALRTAASHAQWLAPLLVLGLALLVTALLLVSVARSIRDRDRVAFEGEVARTTDAVRQRLDTTVTLLHSMAGLFAASKEVERGEFAAYVRQLQLRERFPGILGIGYSARVPASDLPQVEALHRRAVPGFRVWPTEPRDEYHTVLYLEPLDVRNAAALGYDMHTDPIRREAMDRARDSGQPAASGKVTLVQEIDEQKQAGFLIYLPIYRGADTPPDVASRRDRLAGFVYAPLRADDLLRGVRGTGVRLVGYELFDGTLAEPAHLLRSTGGVAAEPTFRASRKLEVGGRSWLLRFGSTPEHEALSQHRLVPWLAAASVTGSVLLGWITWVQVRARHAAEAAAAQRRRSEEALRQSEERARERAHRLEELYAQLREADRHKDEFLAVLAHELRNPLAPIRNAMEILQRAPEGPAAQRAREVALRQVRQMVRLIDDLLDVSRISRGKIELRRTRVSVATLLDAALETSRPLIEQRGHRLEVVSAAPSVELEVDAARIAQILTNLLNNAATYTPPGGVIRLAADAGPAEVRIAVKDTGIGLEPEQLLHVFEMFAQVRTSPAGGGLGIGLSLASRLAEMHGGRIEARSEGTGRGAEFILVLPRQAAALPAAPAAAGQTAPEERAL